MVLKQTSKKEKGFTQTPTLALFRFFKNFYDKIQSFIKKTNHNTISESETQKAMPKLVPGFTLVELIVSIAMFSVVMVVCMSSVLIMLDSNRKSQAQRTLVDNLSYSLDEISRSARFGTVYHCGGGTLNLTQDCQGGDTSFTVLDQTGTQVTYKLSGNRVAKTIGGVDYYLTSPDVTINKLFFFVIGSDPFSTGNIQQPWVGIIIGGSAGVNTNSQSSTTLETVVSQRKLDIYN